LAKADPAEKARKRAAAIKTGMAERVIFMTRRSLWSGHAALSRAAMLPGRTAKTAILADDGPVSVIFLLTAVPRDHLCCSRGGLKPAPTTITAPSIRTGAASW
jgi:hypothetical protein